MTYISGRADHGIPRGNGSTELQVKFSYKMDTANENLKDLKIQITYGAEKKPVTFNEEALEAAVKNDTSNFILNSTSPGFATDATKIAIISF